MKIELITFNSLRYHISCQCSCKFGCSTYPLGFGWKLGVSRDFSDAEKEKKILQSWANSQHDNYFHVLGEKSCHVVNLLSFASNSFFLSSRKIMWLKSQQPKTRKWKGKRCRYNAPSSCFHNVKIVKIKPQLTNIWKKL